MMRVQLRKRFVASDDNAFLDADFEIETGTLIALTGPSGAGKTTVLRLLAGLSRPDEGVISFDNEVWFDSETATHLKTQKRPIGLVFQDEALFPNMTVRENLRFAATTSGEDNFIAELLSATDLADLAHRRPATLSGGQKQRVALARALVRRPRLLLLDEPLSAADPLLRRKLQDLILSLHRRFALTTVLVSHDIAEITRLADRVIVLENGRITRAGRPGEIFVSARISSKFKFPAHVINIRQSDVVFIVEALIGNQVVSVVASQEDVTGLAPGDAIWIAAKAFNPMILRDNQ